MSYREIRLSVLKTASLDTSAGCEYVSQTEMGNRTMTAWITFNVWSPVLNMRSHANVVETVPTLGLMMLQPLPQYSSCKTVTLRKVSVSQLHTQAVWVASAQQKCSYMHIHTDRSLQLLSMEI